MMDQEIGIGEVAQRSGVSIDTVRYYERRQLLPTAPRTPSGYRVFTSDAIERVVFIKQAQDLGFTLDEISTLLTTNGTSDCLRVHDLLDKKLTELDARMKAMHEFREKLTHYLAECEVELEKHPRSAECPVVDEIAHSSGADHNRNNK
jgi:MerR family mercuric resistance operon transcriptional regulator